MRRFLATFVVALLTAFAVQAPAQASQFGVMCYWETDAHGIPRLHCIDIEVALPWDKFVHCWMCGFATKWHDLGLLPATQVQIGQHIVEGVQKLGEAAFAKDPALPRAQAADAFTAAARLSGTARLSVDQIGVADSANNTFNPQPDPPGWFKAGAVDIADGVTLLQRSTDPRNLDLAMAQFDKAYQELSEEVVIAG
jgi:hypothetical protein